MLFELPDPACVMSYETQLCQLTLDFRYTMFFFFFFFGTCVPPNKILDVPGLKCYLWLI